MHIRKLVSCNKGKTIARRDRKSNTEKTHHGRYDPHVYRTAAPKYKKAIDIYQEESYEHESNFRTKLPQKVGLPDFSIKWSDIYILACFAKFINLIKKPWHILPLHKSVVEPLGKILSTEFYFKSCCFSNCKVVVAENIVLLRDDWRCSTEYQLNVDNLAKFRISSLITFTSLYFLNKLLICLVFW